VIQDNTSKAVHDYA